MTVASGSPLHWPHLPLVRQASRALSGNCQGGDVKACTRVGFSKLEILRSRPADTKTGTLIFVCALLHKEVCNMGRYLPVLHKFQRKITLSGPGPGRGGNRAVPCGTCGRRMHSRPKARAGRTYETNAWASGERYPRVRA